MYPWTRPPKPSPAARGRKSKVARREKQSPQPQRARAEETVWWLVLLSCVCVFLLDPLSSAYGFQLSASNPHPTQERATEKQHLSAREGSGKKKKKKRKRKATSRRAPRLSCQQTTLPAPPPAVLPASERQTCRPSGRPLSTPVVFVTSLAALLCVSFLRCHRL